MHAKMVSKYKDQIWLIGKSKHFEASGSAFVIAIAQALAVAQALELALAQATAVAQALELAQALARWQVVNLRGTQQVCLSDFLHTCECRQLV